MYYIYGAKKIRWCKFHNNFTIYTRTQNDSKFLEATSSKGDTDVLLKVYKK